MASAQLNVIISAKDQASPVLRGMTSSLQTLGKVSLGALVGGIGALTAAAGAAAVGIASLAANAEPLVGLQNGFATATERMGSSADVMLAALQDASGGLITNRDLMASFNKAAALVGDQFAEQLPDAMSLVQRAAQATGQDMGFLFDSLVTGVGRVSPMILDNLGIQVSLAEVTELAAEMFGKSAEELSKQEQQMALTEIVLGKLNDAYGDIPAADMTFASIKTSLANLRDEIGLKLLPIVQPLVAKIMELAQAALPVLMDVLDTQILPVLQNVVTALMNFFSQLQNGVDPITAITTTISQLMLAFGATSEQVQAVSQFIWGLISSAQELGAQLMALLSPILEAVGQFVSWKDVLIVLGVAIAATVAAIVGPLLIAVAKIAVVFAIVTAAVAVLRNAWENNWGGIQEKTRAVITFIQNIITTVVTAVRAFWEENGEAILASARRVWQTIQQVVTTVINTVQSIIVAVTGAIRAAWDAHGAEITASAQQFWTAIQDFINATITFIRDGIIIPVATAIAAFWEAHGAAIVAGARAAWETIKGIIDLTMQRIKIILDLATSILRGDWEGFLDSMKALWQNSWDIIISILQAFWDFLSPIIQAIVSEIMGVLQPALDSLQAKFAGVFGAIQGVINSAIGVWDNIVGKIQGFWSWLSGKVFKINISMPSLPSLPGFAAGGPIAAGTLAMVGERGPELFFAPANGFIVPHNQLSGLRGGGAVSSVHIENLILPGVSNSRGFLEEMQNLQVSGTP